VRIADGLAAHADDNGAAIANLDMFEFATAVEALQGAHRHKQAQ